MRITCFKNSKLKLLRLPEPIDAKNHLWTARRLSPCKALCYTKTTSRYDKLDIKMKDMAISSAISRRSFRISNKSSLMV